MNTVEEQTIWEHYAKVEAENFHLKRQLAKKNKELKQHKHFIRVWKNRYEEATSNKKPKFNNRRSYRR